MKSAFYGVAAVLSMALVTYLLRAVPLCFFRKQINSKYVKSFLAYIPYAVLGALTFPDIFYSTGHFYSAMVGTMAAIILAIKEKSLVIVAIGAILAVAASALIKGLII
jgi:branched-subunit amino acid transport protein